MAQTKYQNNLDCLKCPKLKGGKKETFLDTHVAFLGEFQSVSSVGCKHSKLERKDEQRFSHDEINHSNKIIKIETVKRTIEKANKLMYDSDQLTTSIASEILVFMVSDVNPTNQQKYLNHFLLHMV